MVTYLDAEEEAASFPVKWLTIRHSAKRHVANRLPTAGRLPRTHANREQCTDPDARQGPRPQAQATRP